MGTMERRSFAARIVSSAAAMNQRIEEAQLWEEHISEKVNDIESKLATARAFNAEEKIDWDEERAERRRLKAVNKRKRTFDE